MKRRGPDRWRNVGSRLEFIAYFIIIKVAIQLINYLLNNFTQERKVRGDKCIWVQVILFLKVVY